MTAGCGLSFVAHHPSLHSRCKLIQRKAPLPDSSEIVAIHKEDSLFTKLLSRVQERARRIADVMARLHADPTDASRVRGGAGLAAAWRACLSCGSGKDCAAWLEGAPQANVEAPPFCPNAGFLAETCVRPASWPNVSPPRFVGGRSSSGPRRA